MADSKSGYSFRWLGGFPLQGGFSCLPVPPATSAWIVHCGLPCQPTAASLCRRKTSNPVGGCCQRFRCVRRRRPAPARAGLQGGRGRSACASAGSARRSLPRTATITSNCRAFTTKGGIYLSLKANPNALKTLHSGTLRAQWISVESWRSEPLLR